MRITFRSTRVEAVREVVSVLAPTLLLSALAPRQTVAVSFWICHDELTLIAEVINPGERNAIVGFKPSVGLTSQAG